jgi:hypothetical protein
MGAFFYWPIPRLHANVAALLPKVAGSDPRNASGSLEDRHATVTMLAIQENSRPRRIDFKDANDLRVHLDHRREAAKTLSTSASERRIYILEGLNAQFIATLGEYFYMDPSFFVDHETISIWNKNHSETRLTERLPSMIYPNSRFCLP